MTAPNQADEFDNVPDAVVDAESKGFPVVWLLPLVALVIGGWLFYKTESEKGPDITITFNSAEGIESGKTQVKFRDVTVGTVHTVDITDDLKAVALSVTMLNGTEEYLTENSRFWVVKPRIGAGGVTGLGTLFSGAYIAFEPSSKGKREKEFVGLEKPPIVTIDKEGTKFRLRAESLGSISIGAPVYFRQFDIGEITDYKLADDYSYVDIGIFVTAPYDQYVHTGTYFWNVGGLTLSMGASGAKLEMESMIALLSGGVAFETFNHGFFHYTDSATIIARHKTAGSVGSTTIGSGVYDYRISWTGTATGVWTVSWEFKVHNATSWNVVATLAGDTLDDGGYPKLSGSQDWALEPNGQVF